MIYLYLCDIVGHILYVYVCYFFYFRKEHNHKIAPVVRKMWIWETLIMDTVNYFHWEIDASFKYQIAPGTKDDVLGGRHNAAAIG